MAAARKPPRTPIDEYLEGVEDPHRSALEHLRGQIRAELPDAEECITYGVPTFRSGGRSIAGFAAYRRHCSYFPMSGSVLDQVPDAVADYLTSRGTLRFDPTVGLPDDLVRLLIRIRLQQAGG